MFLSIWVALVPVSFPSWCPFLLMPSSGTACYSATWKSAPESLLQGIYCKYSPLNKHGHGPKAIEKCHVPLLQADIIMYKIPWGSLQFCLEIFTLSLSHSSFKSFLWFQEAQLGLTVRAKLRFLKSQELFYYFSFKLFDPNTHQLTSVSLSCCALHKFDIYGMYLLNWKTALILTSIAFPGTDLGHSLEINALADSEEH